VLSLIRRLSETPDVRVVLAPSPMVFQGRGQQHHGFGGVAAEKGCPDRAQDLLKDPPGSPCGRCTPANRVSPSSKKRRARCWFDEQADRAGVCPACAAPELAADRNASVSPPARIWLASGGSSATDGKRAPGRTQAPIQAQITAVNDTGRPSPPPLRACRGCDRSVRGVCTIPTARAPILGKAEPGFSPHRRRGSDDQGLVRGRTKRQPCSCIPGPHGKAVAKHGTKVVDAQLESLRAAGGGAAR